MISLILIAFLVIPYLLISLLEKVISPLQISTGMKGRISLSIFFLLAGGWHFVNPQEMSALVPRWIPADPLTIIYISGVFEIVGAIGVLIPVLYRWAGLGLMLLLIAVTPANIYGAIHQIEFGGHEQGISFLLFRLPVQAFLFFWIYAFTEQAQRFRWFAGKAPKNLGIHNHELSSCPNSPISQFRTKKNCVCSQDQNVLYFIEPIATKHSIGQAKEVAMQIIQGLPSMKIKQEEAEYLHIEATSVLMGYVDDFELYFGEVGKIHVRSASRLGYSDFGLNQQRVEAFRKLYTQTQH